METVLQPDNIKANVLAAVACGSSISEAAKANGLTPAQGRTAISRLCRTAGLSSEISQIQEKPEKYLEISSKIQNSPQYALRRELRKKMLENLHLKSPDAITPKYVSNLTAEMILDANITEVALSEIQEWLVANGTSLKRRAPNKNQHVSLVKKAIFVLDAFGFDTTAAKKQFNGLDG